MSVQTQIDRINSEVNEQSALLDEIATALATKAAATGEDVSAETAEYTAQLDELEETIDSLPDAGSGGGASVEYEIVTITEADTYSIPFTLKRLTNTLGGYSGEGGVSGQAGSVTVSNHTDLKRYSYYYAGSVSIFSGNLSIESGTLTSGVKFACPYTAIFINDPSQPAIYEEA